MSRDCPLPLSGAVVTVGSVLGLLASWAILVVYMLLMTDAVLNPWDAAPTSALPPAGTLSRVLNDLFTSFPAACLPALIVLGVSVGLFLKRAIPTRRFVPLAFRFVAVNVALVVTGVLANPIVWGLERRLLEAWGASLGYSYSRHAVSILFWLLLLFTWFWLHFTPAIWRGCPGREFPSVK